jgi:GAF domain-containing protein
MAVQVAKRVQAELEVLVESRTASLNHRGNQIQLITELGKITSNVRDERELMETSVTLISKRLGFYHAGIFLIDPSGEWAVLKAASSSEGKEMVRKGHKVQVGQQSIVGYVSRIGLPRYSIDLQEDELWFRIPDLPEVKSEITLPFISVSGVFGILDIQTKEDAAFDAEDVEVLHLLASNIALAIENLRLLKEVHVIKGRLDHFQEQDAVRAWQQALSRRNIQIGYAYQSGLIEQLNKPIELEDETELEKTVNVALTNQGLYRLTAKLSVAGHPAGHLVFERATPWSDAAVLLVESVVTQLDLTLNNARLLEETRLRASQEAARSDIIERVRALTSTDAIMRSAAEELGRVLNVERSRIQLVPYDS